MLNLSTKGRYTTRIMINLARSPKGEAKSARIIAEEEELSVDYVEQLLIKMKAAGFVKSRRGKYGGAMLAVNPTNITVAELLDVVEGKMSLAPCITESCAREQKCPTRALWKEAHDAMRDVFESVTIEQLAKESDSPAASFQI